MTLKELMLGSFQSNQGTAVMQMGAKAIQKSGSKSEDAAFGDILGSTMSSTDRQNTVSRNNSNIYADRKKTELVSDTEDNKQKYLSFREVKKASTSEVTARSKKITIVDNQSQLDGDDIVSEKSEVHNQKPDSLLHVFAQVMGLDINDMRKLLNEAGIADESFNNMQGLSENTSKLSQLLGLNGEQEDTLVKMLQLTAKTLDSLTAVESEIAVEGLLPSDVKAAGHSSETAETVKKQPVSVNPGINETLAASTELDAAKLNFMSKLNELSNKPEADQSTIEVELRQLIQTLIGKPAVKIFEPIQQIVEVSTGYIVEQIATADVKAETSGDDDGARQEANTDAGEETTIQSPITAVKESQPQAIFAAVPTDKVNSADVIEKVDVKAPIQSKDIISQVIEKAKVILTPDKSEMLMDLKPDSLGKISLKVVTENGMIMAKFVAESQQVKQVLEANMQLLKDSLEKQGMSLQGFSVSVRQDSNQSARNWTQPKNNRNHNISRTAYRTSGIEGSLVETLEAASNRNPYTWGSSTINLTA